MSNALFEIYGRANSSPWFAGLKRIHCPYPDRELKVLDDEHPCESALYFLCANRGIYYIGISGTKQDGGLFRRLRQHWRKPKMYFHFVYAFGLPADELPAWEDAAIHHFQPEGNFRGRNFYLGNNDAVAGLAGYLHAAGYFSSFAHSRRFRIDVGPERAPPALAELDGN
jgi:hypothetical protein